MGEQDASDRAFEKSATREDMSIKRFYYRLVKKRAVTFHSAVAPFREKPADFHAGSLFPREKGVVRG